MTKYKDDNGKVHEINSEGLAKAILYKVESQKEQGRANWSKICKMLKSEGFDAIKSEGFRQAVKHYQKKTGKLPKRQDFKQSSFNFKAWRAFSS